MLQLEGPVEVQEVFNPLEMAFCLFVGVIIIVIYTLIVIVIILIIDAIQWLI